SYKNYWIDDFYGAIERENNKVSFKTSSTCDDGGSIGGSGGSYNPDLIDQNNSVTWTGSGQTGYTRPSGSWNHYGGTGGYDLQVDVRDVSTGRTETATVNSLTSGEIFYNNGGATPLTAQVYGPTTSLSISTETSSSSGGVDCNKWVIIRNVDGNDTVELRDCALPVQKNSQSVTKAAGDCPVDDGEVGVVDSSVKISIVQRLGLTKGSPETMWLNGDLTSIEIQKVNNLYLFFIEDKTTEATFFGLEAIRAFMAVGEVDFEDKIILDSSFENHQRLKCVYDKFKTGTNTIAGYLKNFLPDNAVGHLNFSADSNFASSFPNQTTAGAATFPPVNGANGSNVPGFNINIVFNTDVTLTSSAQNFPTIILAQELIHEMVHAEMYRKLLECAQLPHVNYNNYTGEQWENFIYSLRDNYEGIHDYFMRYKFYKENGQLIPIEGPTEEQHQQMASHYRNMMIAALKDFDNNQHSPEFYNAISWMGLKGTVAWDDPSVNQSQINSIITNAITNETHNCTN
ncbi:hypothetical protein ACKGJN_16190, partial [Gillisia sp. Q332]|uniref:hypothetical protein n=1 Tax=Gillisia xinjiangensis TaxID=3384765 RepID=UPI00391C8ADC